MYSYPHTYTARSDFSSDSRTINSQDILWCSCLVVSPIGALIHVVGLYLVSICVERFGRKKTILIFTAVKIVGILMAVFGNSYALFVVGRFLMGCGIGSFLPTYVLSKIPFLLTTTDDTIQ